MNDTTPEQNACPSLEVVEGGGITSARGFRACGIHAGFKTDPDRLDFALIVADKPVPVAGVFTKNVFCAPPVRVSREHLDGAGYGRAQAIIINAGNANASTGAQGLEVARGSCELTASIVGCEASDILVASTGVIGVRLPFDPFESGVAKAFACASDRGGHEAACAIMTTDTVSKECAVTYRSASSAYAGEQFTVGGMVKGSGMIMPDMATMIAVLTTDAPLDPDSLHAALVQAVGKSFNKVTVDSDTSTNDSCFLMAYPADDPARSIMEGTSAYEEFVGALEFVCIDLARKIAIDGEGATKLITVNVAGARTDDDADKVARSIANSPLVKTAIFGHDANWGRIAMAAGKSGASFDQSRVSLDMMGMPVLRNGLPILFDEEEALRRFEAPEIIIEIDLGAGNASTTMWTCDFSHDYITINGDYRT